LFVTGGLRRHDVRTELRAYRGIVRLRGRGAALGGALAVAIAAMVPALIGEGGVLSSLVIAGILFIAVLGLDVVMGFAGQVSLGQAGFMAVGGYTAAILAATYGLPPLVGIAAGIALSLICAVVLALVTMRLRGAYLALATLSFGLLIDSLALGLTETTGGPSGLVGIPSLAIGSLAVDTALKMYYVVLGLIVLLILALAGGMRSSFGRALQAIRTDQMAAAALGISVPLYKTAAFSIAAVLASLSGSLYAFQFHFLSPEMVSTPRSFEMIAMLVLGGEGTLVGGIIGAVLITLLPTLFQPLAAYKTVAEGAILVLAFQYLPEGLFGRLVRLLSGLRPARPSARSMSPVR